MTDGRARSTWVQALSLVVAFGSGPLVGIALARVLAPGSFVAEAVGMFAFPLAFAIGIQAWLGLAIFVALVQLVGRLIAGRPWRSAVASAGQVPAGSFVFVPISIVAGGLAGLVIGLVSETRSLPSCLAALLASGAVYGGAVWQLARTGCLPFPDPGA